MTAERRPKPTSTSTARNAVLDALRAAYPGSAPPERLQAIAGRPYPSRIGELRDAGWSIDTGPETAPSYRLRSLVRGEPLVVYGGCIIRIDNRGTKPRTHKESTLPADVLDEAQRAAEEAYRGVLAHRGYGHLIGVHGHGHGAPGASEEPEELDLGFEWEPTPLPPEAEGWDGTDPYGDDEWAEGTNDGEDLDDED